MSSKKTTTGAGGAFAFSDLPPELIAPSERPISEVDGDVSAADVDEDGHIDLIVRRAEAEGAGVRVHLNRGDADPRAAAC